MATSSKVRFNLETLTAQALLAIDLKISQAKIHMDSHEDDEAMVQRVKEWRSRQEEKVRNLSSQLTTISDFGLAKFSIDEMPSTSRYERRDDKRRYENLMAQRSVLEAKAASLVPDAEGTIALTKTQLREFFGL